MRIGIDIDGVLTNMQDYILEEGSKYFYDKNIYIKDPNAYELMDVFGISEEEGQDYWNKFVKEYFNTKDYVKAHASEVIAKLREEGNKIYIITSRGHQGQVVDDVEAQDITKEWLKRNNIIYDDIFFATPGLGKRNVCEEMEIDVMIDDFSLNALEVSKVCKVILFDAKYNQEVKNENITRCFSWYDAYRILKDIKKSI